MERSLTLREGGSLQMKSSPSENDSGRACIGVSCFQIKYTRLASGNAGKSIDEKRECISDFVRRS
jgi:hypothetical protein